MVPPPHIVFVHGFLDDGATWTSVIDAVDLPADRAVTVDLPGMAGAPEHPGPFTLDGYVDEVSAVVDRIEGPVVLVGQSMGAQVAELVAARSDRVAGLVLLTPMPLRGTQLPDEAVAPFRALGGDLEGLTGTRRALSANFPDAELARLNEHGVRIPPSTTAAVVDIWNLGTGGERAESAYPGPVLVVRGAADPLCTEDLVAAEVAPRFRDVRVAVVEGAGHWPHVEQPAALAPLLDEFLGRARRDVDTAVGG